MLLQSTLGWIYGPLSCNKGALLCSLTGHRGGRRGWNKQIPICDTGREGAGQAGHDMAGRSPKIKGQERWSATALGAERVSHRYHELPEPGAFFIGQ